VTYGPVHDRYAIAVIRLVTGMVAHRRQAITRLLSRFERGSDRMRREKNPARLCHESEDLIAIADQIHHLAQDNAYDIRKLAVCLECRPECGAENGENTGHHGEVTYIQ